MAEHLQSNASQDLIWELCRKSDWIISLAAMIDHARVQAQTMHTWLSANLGEDHNSPGTH